MILSPSDQSKSISPPPGKRGRGPSTQGDETEPWKVNRRALVTGATGCIGREIVRLLLDMNWSVNALVRDRASLKGVLGRYAQHPGLRATSGDLNNIETLADAVKDVDTIFHAAAKVHNKPRTEEAQEFTQVNVQGTRNLIRALDGRSLKNFVFLSTIAVYGQQTSGILTETTPVAPDTPYAQSKHAAESVVKQMLPSSTRVTILRLPLVYGPGDRGNFLKMIKAIEHGKFLLIDGGRARKSVIYSADAAAAAVKSTLSQIAGCETFLIAYPHPYELRRIAECISRELRIKPTTLSVPSQLLAALFSITDKIGLKRRLPYGAYEVRVLSTDRICQVSKMKSLLDFQPAYQLEAGVKKTIEWYKQSQQAGSVSVG